MSDAERLFNHVLDICRGLSIAGPDPEYMKIQIGLIPRELITSSTIKRVVHFLAGNMYENLAQAGAMLAILCELAETTGDWFTVCMANHIYGIACGEAGSRQKAAERLNKAYNLATQHGDSATAGKILEAMRHFGV